MAPKRSAEPVEATRKSARSSTIASSVEALKVKEIPAKKGSEKTGDESDDEDDEDQDEDDDEEEVAAPAPKKAKKAGAMKVGEIVVDFKLRNEDDEEVSLLELVKENGIVIFTYPRANTPGCTSQACNFRDLYDEIKKTGYEVYGMSTDKPKSQLSWKTSKKLGFSLLSDPESTLLARLGATAAKKRCHFIIEKGGKLLEAAIGVSPKTDAQNSLDFITAL